MACFLGVNIKRLVEVQLTTLKVFMLTEKKEYFINEIEQIDKPYYLFSYLYLSPILFL